MWIILKGSVSVRVHARKSVCARLCVCVLLRKEKHASRAWNLLWQVFEFFLLRSIWVAWNFKNHKVSLSVFQVSTPPSVVYRLQYWLPISLCGQSRKEHLPSPTANQRSGIRDGEEFKPNFLCLPGALLWSCSRDSCPPCSSHEHRNESLWRLLSA